jgi:hypothetical protein
MLYLLQLVQALKFESMTSSDQRSSRSANSAISQEDSGLGDFLIDRAVENTVFGNKFYWYLMVEIGVEDKVTSKLYARVVYRFQNRIAEVGVLLTAYIISHLHVVRLMVPSDETCYGDRQNLFRSYPTKPRNSEPTRTRAQRRLTNSVHSSPIPRTACLFSTLFLCHWTLQKKLLESHPRNPLSSSRTSSRFSYSSNALMGLSTQLF